MIDKTDEQFDQFEIIMSSIFEQIYMPKKDRKLEYVGSDYLMNTSLYKPIKKHLDF